MSDRMHAFERLHRQALRLEWITTLWNIVEAVIAIGAGILSSSTALIAFGVDSLIEVLSAVGVLWRMLRAGPQASAEEHSRAERRALFVVAGSFFLLAVYITLDAGSALLRAEAPENSIVGLALSVASLIAMPTLAHAKQRTARAMGSKSLEADAIETWVCAYLSASLLLGLGLHQHAAQDPSVVDIGVHAVATGGKRRRRDDA